MPDPIQLAYVANDPQMDFHRVRRGECKIDICDCMAYFYNGKDPLCLYCTHPPAVQQNLGAVVKEIHSEKPSSPDLDKQATEAIGKVVKKRVIIDPKTLEAFEESYESDATPPVTPTGSPAKFPGKNSGENSPGLPRTVSFWVGQEGLRRSPRKRSNDMPSLVTESPTKKAVRVLTKAGDQLGVPDKNRLAKQSPSPSTSSSPTGHSGTETSLPGLPKDIQLKELFPKHWPIDLQEAFDSDSYTRAQRCEVIRTLVYGMDEKGLTDDVHFRYVAILARGKIPISSSTLLGKKDALVQQMKECLKNKRANARARLMKRSAGNAGPAQSAEDAKSMMAELPSDTSSGRFKVLLTACRKLRMKETREMTANEMLNAYPALKKPGMIEWEFVEIVKLQIGDMKKKWEAAFPALAKHFNVVESDEELLSMSTDKLAVELLSAFHAHLGPERRKKSTDESRKILYICKEGTTVKATIPKAADPPCMIAIEDESKDRLSFTVYADGKALFVGGAVDSLLNLIATYWVFNVEFPASV